MNIFYCGFNDSELDLLSDRLGIKHLNCLFWFFIYQIINIVIAVIHWLLPFSDKSKY